MSTQAIMELTRIEYQDYPYTSPIIIPKQPPNVTQGPTLHFQPQAGTASSLHTIRVVAEATIYEDRVNTTTL